MKPRSTKPLALIALCLTLAAPASRAATFTWDGEGVNGNWSTGTNWVGNAAPSGSGHNLIFSGSSQTAAINNAQLSSVLSLYFSEGAAAFTLSGSNLTLSGVGNITNASAVEQTISLNLQMTGHRSFDTKEGNIVIAGVISADAAHRTLNKEGKGILEFRGVNTYAGPTRVLRGTLQLDATTGSLGSTSGVTMGDPTLHETGNNAAFVVKGANYSGTNINVANLGANIIKADKIALRMAAFATSSQGTMNFDVSGAGSSITFTAAPALTAGRILQTTVTGTNGTTSFATIDGSNQIVALSGLTDLSTNPATTTNTNASLAGGSYNNTQANRALNSLTLAGSGGGSVTGQNLQSREILMQEGTGNYTFDVAVSPNVATYTLFLHQYSTEGVLRFNSALLADNATGGLVKAGAGSVQIGASSTSTFTGTTRIQSGTLLLDGALTKSSVQVYEGATLRGGGSIGSGANPTPVRIRAGGTLGASSASALDVTGTLALDSESTFVFTLGAGLDSVHVTGAITLASGVTLELNLLGAPVFETPLYLLRSDTSIAGSFMYENAIIANGNTFSYGGYDFTYFQDSQNIWLYAVPEPSVVVLGAFGLLFLLMRRGLRRKTAQ